MIMVVIGIRSQFSDGSYCCYYFGEENVCYSLAKCCCRIKENEEDEDAVSFYMKVFLWQCGIKSLCLCCKSRRKERSKETK